MRPGFFFCEMSMPVEIFLRPDPVSLATDLHAWMLSIKAKIGKRILENLTANTDALTRAGIFMGAGKGMKARTLVRQDDFPLLNYKKLVAGHNLPGPVLRDFFAATSEPVDPSLAANEAERAVRETFVKSPRLELLKDSFYLIGFSIQTMKDQKGVISHEVFHALSFLNADYREVVRGFWREHVSAEDRAAITNEIGLAYNVDDEDLVIDEFQAYLVQSGAERDRMKTYVPKYRDALLSELRAAGLVLPVIS